MYYLKRLPDREPLAINLSAAPEGCCRRTHNQMSSMNELDETIRCLETSVAEVEDVLRAAASIEDCRHSCTAYLESLRQAMRDMEELDRIELGTLRDAESYAETAQEHIGYLVSGYRCSSTED